MVTAYKIWISSDPRSDHSRVVSNGTERGFSQNTARLWHGRITRSKDCKVGRPQRTWAQLEYLRKQTKWRKRRPVQRPLELDDENTSQPIGNWDKHFLGKMVFNMGSYRTHVKLSFQRWSLTWPLPHAPVLKRDMCGVWRGCHLMFDRVLELVSVPSDFTSPTGSFSLKKCWFSRS